MQGWHITIPLNLCKQCGAGSGEKFEPINTNSYLSIINRLFNEINRLFLEFLLEIENFIENRSDISLKFFISTGYFQISTGYLISKPPFSLDIGVVLISRVLDPTHIHHMCTLIIITSFSIKCLCQDSFKSLINYLNLVLKGSLEGSLEGPI
jgi:hypothetical protein